MSASNVIPLRPVREVDMDALAAAERRLGVAHLEKFRAALNDVILAEREGDDDTRIAEAWEDLARAQHHLERARGILA